MDSSEYPHESAGTLLFDPGIGTRHFEPWWVLLQCDAGIVDYYSWLLRRRGITLHKGSLWGPHVTVVRGLEPPEKSAWGRSGGVVTFRYTNVVRWDNGRHAWLDVWSPNLAAVRAGLGFPEEKARFHLTLGRLTDAPPAGRSAEPGSGPACQAGAV